MAKPWVGTCRTCGLEKELDEETTIDIAEFICFSCAEQFWKDYFAALAACHREEEHDHEHHNEG